MPEGSIVLGEFRLVSCCPAYRVSDDGRVQSCWKPKSRPSVMTSVWHDLRQSPVTEGYLRVVLQDKARGFKRDILVNILVLETFVGPRPEGMECRHLDGNRTNNRLDNLEWGTSKQNAADRKRHGTAPQGKRHGMARLDETVVRKILALLSEGNLAQGEIAKQFGISRTVVNTINCGHTWMSVPRPDRMPCVRPRAILKEGDIPEIRRLVAEGKSQGEIARRFGVARSTVESIVVGRNWRHVT